MAVLSEKPVRTLTTWEIVPRLGRLWLIAVAWALQGAQAPSLEPAVKATFVYKFAPFVEWPAAAFASRDMPLVICVLGSDAVGPLIDQAAAGQRVGNRPIVVRHIMRVERGTACHELYAANATDQGAADAFATVQGSPVLTVSDGQSSAHAMITFVRQGNRVGFDIDERSAAESGLSISSRLLSLARNVIPRSR